MIPEKYFNDAMNVRHKIQCLGMTLEASQLNAFVALFSAEKYVNGAILQWNRIQETKKLLPGKGPGVDGSLMQKLFLDIHFYFISCDKVQNLLEHFIKIDADSKLVELWEHLRVQFKSFNDARNDLEHIETRITAKNLADFGNLSKNIYTFGGREYDISMASLKIVTDAYTQTIDILKSR